MAITQPRHRRNLFHTIWLKASPELHMKRLLEQGDERPKGAIRRRWPELTSILTSREGLCARAEGVVETEGRSIEESTCDLVEAVRALGVA